MTTKKAFSWVLLFLFVSLCIAVEPILMIVHQESIGIAIGVLRYTLILLSFASFLLLCSSWIGRKTFSAAISTLLVFNLFSLKLSFYPAIINLNTWLYWAVFLSSILLLYKIISRAIKHEKVPNLVAFALPAIVFLSPAVLTLIQDSASNNQESIPEKITSWKNLTLSQKPNIYLLSYDSLIPKDVAKDFLNLNKVPYEPSIERFFFEIANTLNFKVPTVPSLNSVMRLDQKYQELGYDLFTGRKPSVLEQLAHGNGYRVTTGFSTYYFGAKGQFVDDYLTLGGVPFNNTTLCIELGDNTRMKMRLLFLCSAFSDLTSGPLFDLLFSVQSADRIASGWHDKIIEHIKKTATSNKPTLSFFYTFRPLGHTPQDYNHIDSDMRNAYREYFIESAQSLNAQLAEINSVVLKYDPNAIVVLFGDHGAWMSRRADPNFDPSFVYRDRHKVLMGLMKTNNSCANPKEFSYSKHYATPSRLLLDIFTCLGMNGVQTGLVDLDEDESVLRHALTF